MKKIITIIVVLAVISVKTTIAGTITGTVISDSNGQPIQGLWVYACDYTTGQYCGGGSTNLDGFYSINSLTAGIYRVAISTAGTEFVQEYYNNVINYEAATAVNVPASGVVWNIDFGLAVGGSITGTVRDANGNPLYDIPINAHCDALNYGRMEHSNANGIYELTSLPAGTYRVELATWDPCSDNYAKQYYDHTIYWEQHTPVYIQPGQQVTSIDFDLMQGASLSGYVKDPNGTGIGDTEIVSFIDNQWFTNTFTEANGFYRLRNLMPEITYEIAVYPPDSTDYMITRIFVNIPDVNDYTAPDIYLQTGALTVSGKVTDKITSLPIAGIWVSCHFDDLDLWGGRSQTDINGMYALTNLIPGEELEIRTESPPQYARIGTQIELEHDVNNMDFALPPAATLSGKVIDALTAEPLAGIGIEYDNDRYSCWDNTFTDAEGEFAFGSLPEGIAEVMAQPSSGSGYAWSLSWGSNWVWLDEGQHKSDRIIALQRGALVKGNVKYADNSPAAYIEVSYQGSVTEGWLDADVNGHYEIILPQGKYAVYIDYDDDEFSALPVCVTVNDPNQTIILPDLVAYDDDSGETISGTVTSNIGAPAPGWFWIAAFPTGSSLDPNNLQTITFAGSGCDLEEAGPFEITALPPDANYDIYLFVACEDLSGIESVALRDAAINVSCGSTSINLNWDSFGGTVKGTVVNTRSDPVLGATVLLNDVNTGIFGGLADVNENGLYVIYSAAPSTYTVTAIHSKYLNKSTTVKVVEGVTVDANTIIMSFAGEKEGADLNGDGVIDMLDVAEFSDTWLESGSSEADFNQDSRVNFKDWVRMAENWQSKAIWYQE